MHQPSRTSAAGRDSAEKAGVKVWNIGNSNVHNMPEVTLNLPGRDQKVDGVQEVSSQPRRRRNPATPRTPIWATASGVRSRKPLAAARSHARSTSKPRTGCVGGENLQRPLSHGREYTEKEIWDNYTYFIPAGRPGWPRNLASASASILMIHPCRSSLLCRAASLATLMATFRALEIANSPNVGVCLCCGTWLEGGPGMGKDVVEAIKAFAGMGSSGRSTSATSAARSRTLSKPTWTTATWICGRIMKTLREVDFRGILIADHVPEMIGGRKVGWAYSIGYIKALLNRANAEAVA